MSLLSLFVSLHANSAEVVSPVCGTWTLCQVKKEIASPVTTKAKYSLLTGAGVIAGLFAFQDQLIYQTQRETAENKPLGSTSRYGDLAGQMLPNGLYIAGMLMDYKWGAGASGKSTSLDRAVLMTKASAYSGLVTTTLKYTVRERRPNGSGELVSFPSGHTTTAFAFASTVQALHGWGWGAPAYLLATFVGYSRMNDNAHYIHDVVGGAAIGIAYGVGVTEIYKKDKQSESQEAWQLYLWPSDDGFGTQLRLARSF